MNTENYKILHQFKKYFFAALLGLAVTLISELAVAFLIHRETIPFDMLHYAAFVPVFLGSVSACIFGSGREKVLISGLFSGLLFLAMLWICGLLIYNGSLSFTNAIFAASVVFGGCIMTSFVKALVGSKK